MPNKHTKPGSKKQPIPEYSASNTLVEAKAIAESVSKTYPGIWYLIESGDKYFVQDSCLLQEWETLHKKYCGGKIL